MLKIQLKFFGQFKQYLEKEICEIELISSMRLDEFKPYLENSLRQSCLVRCESNQLKALLELSVFADETRILGENERITKDCQIAVLPPVCGG
jgi:molybdopterin converting factor small subunit